MKKPIWNRKRLNRATFATMLVTVALFLIAAAEKGISHDLSLEAAVFLVSLKLVLSSHRSELSDHAIEVKLDRIQAQLDAAEADKRKSA